MTTKRLTNLVAFINPFQLFHNSVHQTKVFSFFPLFCQFVYIKFFTRSVFRSYLGAGFKQWVNKSQNTIIDY